LENQHLSSSVEHKATGLLSEDRHELKGLASFLLHDKELVGRIGEEARKEAAECFSLEEFAGRFQGSIGRSWRN
jgi:glycosyltransferase involved in cell wall biosynthesis